MSRSVESWASENADARFPPRVRLRIFDRCNGRCQKCTRKLGPADKWEIDHIKPLIAGGANSEENAQVLCSWCHSEKTADDVAEKSTVYEKRAKHLGIELKPKRRWGFR